MLLVLRFREREREREREMSLGRRGDKICRERSGRNERKSRWSIYIENHKARWIERYQALKMREIAIKELSRICRGVSTAKGPRWIEKLLSIYRASKTFLNGSSSYREAIKNAIKRSWKVSIDSLAIERCPAAVEIA